MRADVQLLVGQTATLNLQMAPSTVQETVTVTGEAPLIDLKNSSLGGKHRRPPGAGAAGQRPQLDGAGAAGARQPHAGGGHGHRRADPAARSERRRGARIPAQRRRSAGVSRHRTGGQAKFSQDSIAEFQFVANRFDATMGRSTGVQVNAITKSGSNQVAGLFRGNFRNSRFNAENPVLHTVEKVDNQQYSTTFGGPIMRDKLHFFGNYEYEREPRESIFNSPYPVFNGSPLVGKNTQQKVAFASITRCPRRRASWASSRELPSSSRSA